MTLPDLILWLRERWTARELPMRIHAKEIGDDGAPAFHPAFSRHLSARPDDAGPVTSTRTCHHPRIAKDAGMWDCPDCQGTGVYESTTYAYRYPMWRALDLLYHQDYPSYEVVLTFVIAGYSTDAMSSMRVSADALHHALMGLHSRYALGPVHRARAVNWTEKSESQQRAELLPA